MSSDPIRWKIIENKLYSNDAFKNALAYGGKDAPDLMRRSIKMRLKTGNVVIQIFGPTDSAKSEIAQTLFFDYISPTILDLGFKSTPSLQLKKFGVTANLAITRNYAQSILKISEMDGTGDVLTVIQDEGELLTGEGKLTLKDHELNFLAQGRKTHHNIIRCNVTEDKSILPFTTFSLESLIRVKYKWNSTMLYAEDEPIGLVKFRYHNNIEFRNWYEDQKDRAIHKSSTQKWSIGAGAIEDIKGISNKILETTIKENKEFPRLIKDHFEITTGEDFSYLKTVDSKRAANLAWLKYRLSKKLENERIKKEPKGDRVLNAHVPDPEHEDPFEKEFYDNNSFGFADQGTKVIWLSRGFVDHSVPDFFIIHGGENAVVNVKDYTLRNRDTIKRTKYQAEIKFILASRFNKIPCNGYVYVRDKKTKIVNIFEIDPDNDHQKMFVNINATPVVYHSKKQYVKEE